MSRWDDLLGALAAIEVGLRETFGRARRAPPERGTRFPAPAGARPAALTPRVMQGIQDPPSVRAFPLEPRVRGGAARQLGAAREFILDGRRVRMNRQQLRALRAEQRRTGTGVYAPGASAATPENLRQLEPPPTRPAS